MIYKFGIGRAKLTALETVLVKEIETATNIEFDYNVTESQQLGPEGEIQDTFKEEEKTSLTIEFADDIDTDLILGQRYDIELTPGVEGGGFTSIDLTNCRLTGYNVKSTQGQFVIVRVTFTKIGAIGSSNSDPTADLQTIKFGSIYLGDSAYLTSSYEGNVVSRIIPTALGTIFQTTGQTGGGKTTIKVTARVKKDTRLLLEAYVTNLFSSLSTDEETLTIEQSGDEYTLTNCVFVTGSMNGDYKTHTEIQLEFQKSSY